MISMFTSDSQHSPRSRHAVHLGDICYRGFLLPLFIHDCRSTGTLACSENQDEMPHKHDMAAYHQIHHFIEILTAWLPHKIQNGQFHAYCIKMYRKIHKNE